MFSPCSLTSSQKVRSNIGHTFARRLTSEHEIPKQHQKKRQTKKTTKKDECDFEKRIEKILPQICDIFRVKLCCPIRYSRTPRQRCPAMTAKPVLLIYRTSAFGAVHRHEKFSFRCLFHLFLYAIAQNRTPNCKCSDSYQKNDDMKSKIAQYLPRNTSFLGKYCVETRIAPTQPALFSQRETAEYRVSENLHLPENRFPNVLDCVHDRC
jgi:hypothetical protein